MTALMDVVLGCENYLGWQPRNPRQPLWQARSVEIARLQKSGSPVEHLWLALEYCRRKRLLSSPSALIYKIQDALAIAHAPTTPTDAAQQITNAVRWEHDRDDSNSLRWIHRLTRCSGPGREDVLAEWRSAGRG